MQNRRRIIIMAGSVVAACALILGGLLVFRSRPAPSGPVIPISPVAQQLVSPSPGSRSSRSARCWPSRSTTS